MRGSRLSHLLNGAFLLVLTLAGLSVSAALADVSVSVDVKPGSCPNVLARRSRGFLSVAILGSETFDVSLVDASSVKLHVVDGIGTLGAQVAGVEKIGSIDAAGELSETTVLGDSSSQDVI